MSSPAKTSYAKSGEVYVAYQVTGKGPVDLLLAPGFISHLEHSWEEPQLARWQLAMSQFARFIRFDKRGTGLSDRSVGIPHLDERMDDIRAVLDAVGSSKAALMGVSEGGPMSILFAATYPERVSALILCGTYAHHLSAGPALGQDRDREYHRLVDEHWGTGESLSWFGPGSAKDPQFRDWWARLERLSSSPSAVLNLRRMNQELDVRHILPAIQVPTLVLHRRQDCRISFEAGKYLADHIPGAKLVELPEQDHLYWVGEGGQRVVEETQRFLLGTSPARETDRILSTVLFTDIVDSTKQAAAMGDRSWQSLRQAHDLMARSHIQRFRGREIKSTGDGFLAIFDGPARAVRCALGIVQAVSPLGIAVRAGLHTGEIELSDSDVSGVAVHTAARVSQMAAGGAVLVSSTVKDLVAGAGIRFGDLGPQCFKGLDEPIRVFRAEPPAGPAS